MVGILSLAPTGKYQNEIHDSILKTLMYNIDDATFINTLQRNPKYIDNDRVLNVSSIIKTALKDKHFGGLHDYKVEIKEKLKDFSLIIVVRMPLFETMSNNNNSLILRYKANEKEEKLNFKFMTTIKIFVRLAILEVLEELNVNLIQIKIDPQEYSIETDFAFKNYTCYFINNRSNMKYMPMYINQMFKSIKDGNLVECRSKDIFAIATCLSDDRKDLPQKFDGIICDNIDIRFITKENNRKARVKQSDYYELLRGAKYTIIFKPYQHDSFSSIRFIEAILNGCVPLIMNDCDLSELKETYLDLYELVLKYNLVVSSIDVKTRVQKYDYDKNFIDEAMSSDSITKEINDKKVKKFFERMVEKYDV